MSATTTIFRFNLKEAVIYSVLSAVAFSIMAVFVKFASSSVSNNIITFFRFLISFVYVLIIIGASQAIKKPITVKTEHIWLHLTRAFFAFLSILLLYYSLRYISLVDGTLLNTTYTLFLPILTIVIIKMKTPWQVWVGVFIGFVGVAFVLHPSVHVFNSAALIALASGFFAAVSSLAVRFLTKYDNHYTIAFYYFLVALVLSGILSIFNWQTPSWHDFLILLGVGVMATAYQEFFVRATYHAPARIVSSISYLNVVFSGILGWLIWDHVPSLYGLIGIILILISGIYTLFYAVRTDMAARVVKKDKNNKVRG